MTTYFVDFVNGSDANSGLATTAAWQHSPYDSEATLGPKNVVIQAGDVIQFRGGVAYQGGTIVPPLNNSPDITFIGTGWGEGRAIISGMSSASLMFTPYNGSPAVSVATLPTNLSPGGYASGPESAINNIVMIDGVVQFMANNSPSKNPYYPDSAASATAWGGQTQIPLSEVVGNSTTWTITDATLAAFLSTLPAGELTNILLHVYQGGNSQCQAVVQGLVGNVVTMKGNYYTDIPAASKILPAYSIYNVPAYVGSANPYPMYSIQGNQLIAAIPAGNHTVGVSTRKNGIHVRAQEAAQTVMIDGFEFYGFGAGDGRAILAQGGGTVGQINNLTIQNCYFHDISTHWVWAYGAIYCNNCTGVSVSNNIFGPNIFQGVAVIFGGCTNVTCQYNQMSNLGWDGIIFFNDQNVLCTNNTIENCYAPHTIGIIAYSTNSVIPPTVLFPWNIDIIIANNTIINVPCGIAFQGSTGHSTYPPFRNYYTISGNVISGAQQGIYNFGKVNGSAVFSNIIMTTLSPPSGQLLEPSFNPGPNGNANDQHNNLLATFPYVNAASPEAGYTYENNTAVSTHFCVRGVPPAGGGNAIDPTQLPIVNAWLANMAEPLPASIAAILGTSSVGAGAPYAQ